VKDLVVVSIMPCTAKKFEAKRPEFSREGGADVDFVLTTQELALMIEEAGLRFSRLEPQSFDMPMGFKTGAGVIFGNSGGVSEAVLRYAAEKLTGSKLDKVDFPQVRGENGLRRTTVRFGETELKLAVVHGLRNARSLCEEVLAGSADYDLIEVMACPGGCIGGAGQPLTRHGAKVRRLRARGLYEADRNLELHKSQDNYFVSELYNKVLDGQVGGHKAHSLLHTCYTCRSRGNATAATSTNGEDH
jgi:NADH-quinone oxidoreductase subunit G